MFGRVMPFEPVGEEVCQHQAVTLERVRPRSGRLSRLRPRQQNLAGLHLGRDRGACGSSQISAGLRGPWHGRPRGTGAARRGRPGMLRPCRWDQAWWSSASTLTTAPLISANIAYILGHSGAHADAVPGKGAVCPDRPPRPREFARWRRAASGQAVGRLLGACDARAADVEGHIIASRGPERRWRSRRSADLTRRRHCHIRPDFHPHSEVSASSRGCSRRAEEE